MTIHALPTPELSRQAADLFRARQRSAQAKVASGEWSIDQATTKLRPWLAIACLAGADLPELDEALADQRGFAITAGFPDRHAAEANLRTLAANEICPRHKWASLLAKARDMALDAHAAHLAANPGNSLAGALFDRAVLCSALCQHLDVRLPYIPTIHAAPERKVA